jgi:hypothetical protein
MINTAIDGGRVYRHLSNGWRACRLLLRSSLPSLLRSKRFRYCFLKAAFSSASMRCRKDTHPVANLRFPLQPERDWDSMQMPDTVSPRLMPSTVFFALPLPPSLYLLAFLHVAGLFSTLLKPAASKKVSPGLHFFLKVI